VLFSVIAILLGRAGLKQAGDGEGRRGRAIAAIALGAVSLLLVLGYLVDQVRD
jgi:hypothetical protein